MNTQDLQANNDSVGREANILTTAGKLDSTRAFTELHLADGRVLRLNTRALMAETASGFEAETRPADLAATTEQQVIPLLEEQLTVGKRTVVTGVVRLEKTVHEYSEALNEPLAVRTFDIERVELNQPVEHAPAVRQEGDTPVYPVVEERLILTKQLILKEEVRVTRRDTERRDTQVVTLKRERLTVEREAITE